jgi:hypothetical protein
VSHLEKLQKGKNVRNCRCRFVNAFCINNSMSYSIYS